MRLEQIIPDAISASLMRRQLSENLILSLRLSNEAYHQSIKPK